MKRLYQILNIILWCFVGVFIGTSIYQYHDYTTHPMLYSTQSAPWYTSIVVRGIFTAVLVVVLSIAKAILKKRVS